MNPNINKSRFKTNELYGWIAHLCNGSSIYEGEPSGLNPSTKKLSLSSDHLPEEDVVAIQYVHLSDNNRPVITCNIDLDKGSKFIRYWTTIKSMSRSGSRKLYALGWYSIKNNNKVYAILYLYPDGKVSLSNNRLSGPPYSPSPFILLENSIIIDKRISGYIGWKDPNQEAYLVSTKDGLIFRSSL